jgi:hypothetical protein
MMKATTQDWIVAQLQIALKEAQGENWEAVIAAAREVIDLAVYAMNEEPAEEEGCPDSGSGPRGGCSQRGA